MTKNLRCGECGHRGLTLKNVRGWWGMPWKDYPHVVMQVDFQLPVCPKCNNVVIPGGVSRLLDKALEQSISKTISELLGDIKNRYNISFKEMGRLTGVTPQYMSMLLNEKRIPSYQFVQLLRIMKTHPEILDEMRNDWNDVKAAGS